MREYGHRVAEVAAFLLLLALLVFPMTALAEDAADPSVPQATATVADGAGATDPLVGDVAASPESSQTEDPQVDPAAPEDAGTVAAESADVEPGTVQDAGSAAPESAEPAEDAASTPATATQVSSQANPDTKAAIEAVLKSRKRQFDASAAALQRSIDQLAAIIRRLDAADVNTSAARARLAEARTALARARAAERLAVARYRGVIGADDEGDAYANARAAARSSSLQLERARVKVLTAARTLRAIVKNVTV